MKYAIGLDNTVDGQNAVYVVADHGEVEIRGPGEGWLGFATLASLDDEAEAEAIALRIAADPVAELAALGYDTEGWFEPIAHEGR